MIFEIRRVLDVIKVTDERGEERKVYRIDWLPTMHTEDVLNREAQRDADYCNVKVIGPLDNEKNLSEENMRRMTWIIRKENMLDPNDFILEELTFKELRNTYSQELVEYFVSKKFKLGPAQSWKG